MLTADRLRELLTYDPATGEFRWLVKRGNNGANAGDIAGSSDKTGRRFISVDGKDYRANRLAWLYMTGAWPKRHVDHRDTNPGNDRWENLREATKAQNGANRGANRNNTTGVKGVTRLPSGNYEVRIGVNGRRIHLGTTDNLTIAGYMYRLGAAFYHGEFARAA